MKSLPPIRRHTNVSHKMGTSKMPSKAFHMNFIRRQTSCDNHHSPTSSPQGSHTSPKSFSPPDMHIKSRSNGVPHVIASTARIGQHAASTNMQTRNLFVNATRSSPSLTLSSARFSPAAATSLKFQNRTMPMGTSTKCNSHLAQTKMINSLPRISQQHPRFGEFCRSISTSNFVAHKNEDPNSPQKENSSFDTPENMAKHPAPEHFLGVDETGTGDKKPEKSSNSQDENDSSNKTPEQTTVQMVDPDKPYNWATVVSLLLMGGGAYAYFDYLKRKKEEKLKEQEKSVGKAMIGGAWTLVDQDGNPMTDANFRGKYLLVYFGFTFCPDICPIELQKMADVMDKLAKVQGMDSVVQPIFISIDPNRDSVAAVREYVKEFHPKLMGFTGTPEQVESVARKFRVYLSPTHISENSDDQDYLLDHSIIIYLMDPRGQYLDFFGNNMDSQAVTERIMKRIFEQHDLVEQPKKGWFSKWW